MVRVRNSGTGLERGATEMLQIVKGKKKGRPLKADLAMRSAVLAPEKANDSSRRRSSRLRNVRCDSFVDYEDYLDEYVDLLEREQEVSEEEEERGKEKKLRLVLNLHVEKRERGRKRGRRSSVARVLDAPKVEVEDEEKPLTKKRRVNESEDEEQEYRRNEEEEYEEEEEGRGGRKGGNGGGEDSAAGTPSELAKELPLPDKKALEVILIKLQKKDVYDAYAEPVDLEELPDYLDVVDHPMDFSTVRKKLANGSYATMEQFESDVFLICSNAMRYNASDTVFYKQARTIQELAIRKFEKIRTKIERSERAERETKAEQKTKTNSLVKKQMKKPFSGSVQEPVGSDFSSGAILATPVDAQNGFVDAHGGGCERSIDDDVHVENSAIADNIEKVEELSSGKVSLTKLGRKSSLLEERRATYDIPNHPVVSSESIFTTFNSEIKQLVAVGLHADYSYARSVARFAATLGPVAWKVASQKIERALPPGYKYGRGWVGEHEPLPTPVLMPEACNRNESIFSAKFQFPSDNQDGDVMRRASELGQENPSKRHTSEFKSVLPNPSSRLSLDGKPHSSSSRTRPSTPVSLSCPQQNLPLKRFWETRNNDRVLHASNTPVVDGNLPADCSSESKNVVVDSPSYQQQNLPPPRNFPEKRNKSSKLGELNLTPSSNFNDTDVGEEKHPSKSEILPPLKSREASGKTGHLNSVIPKQYDGVEVSSRGLSNGKAAASSSRRKMVSSSADGTHNIVARAATLLSHQGITEPVEESGKTVHLNSAVPKQYDGVGVSSRCLSNGKAATSSSTSKMVSSSADGTCNTVTIPATLFPNQGLTDPVEAIRMSALKAQSEQKSPNPPSIDKPAVPSVPSARNDSNNAAVSAARAWMSIGAGGYGIPAGNSVAPKGQFPVESLYNPTWQFRPQVSQVQGQFPFPAGMDVPSEKNDFPFQAFRPQTLHAADGAHFQNRPMIFPQLVTTDFSRFQMQFPMQSPSPHHQPKQKLDTLPPDLNIRFQSPDSPGKQSSGPMADSQLPDLALQL